MAVFVQTYSFTSAPIARALVDAHKRGIKVQVIVTLVFSFRAFGVKVWTLIAMRIHQKSWNEFRFSGSFRCKG